MHKEGKVKVPVTSRVLYKRPSLGSAVIVRVQTMLSKGTKASTVSGRAAIHDFHHCHQLLLSFFSAAPSDRKTPTPAAGVCIKFLLMRLTDGICLLRRSSETEHAG